MNPGDGGLRGLGGVRFLVHPELVESVEQSAGPSADCVSAESIPADVLRHITSAPSVLARGAREASFLQSYTRNFPCQRLLLMYINTIQMSLGRIRNVPSISGILFNPARLHEPSTAANGPVLERLFRRYRKLVQYWWMTRQRRVEKVFILEDPGLVAHLNQTRSMRPVFSNLADPINQDVLSELRLVNSATPSASVFRTLSFGTIEPRKGILHLLNALALVIDNDPPARVELSLIGRYCDTDHKLAVANAIAKCHEVAARRGREFVVEAFEGYATPRQIAEELRRASVVHVGYHNFSGSSGVLGLAAAAKKPVIGCDKGLIGETIRRLGLGPAVNVIDSEAYARCIRDFIIKGWALDEATVTRMVTERSPTAFAAALLGASEAP